MENGDELEIQKIIEGDFKKNENEEVYIPIEPQKQVLTDFNAEMKALGRKPATRRSYIYTLYKLGKQCRKPFKEITKKDIIDFLNTVENDATKKLYKVQLKYFYRWLYGMKKHQYPEQVDWIETHKVKTKITKDELLTPEELKRVIIHAPTTRDKAFIATHWEAADRPSEHLSLKVGSVEQTDYGFILHIQVSKTETRSVAIHQTASYLARWLNEHPFRDNPDAPLWVNIGRKAYGEPLRYTGAYQMIRKAKRKAGIKKPLSPKWLRHRRLTDLAKKVREPQLKAIAGWTPDSRMAGVYVHLSGMDTVEPVLEAEGVKPPETQKPWLQPIECPRCKTVNDPTAIYCMRCAAPLKIGVMLASKPIYDEEMKRLREEVNNLRKLIQDSTKIKIEYLQEAYEKTMMEELASIEEQEEK